MLCSLLDQPVEFKVSYHNCRITGVVPAAVLLSRVQINQSVPSLPTAVEG